MLLGDDAERHRPGAARRVPRTTTAIDRAPCATCGGSRRTAMSSSRTMVNSRAATSPRVTPVRAASRPRLRARVDAQHADRFRPRRVTTTWRSRPRARARAGRRRSSPSAASDRDVGVHHLARAADQEHVGVQRLRDRMAAADQLQRVDVLARQHAAHAEAHRDREDHRQHDVVVARHLEDHRHGGHHRAGAAADHRAHADHGEGGHARRRPGSQRVEQRRRKPPPRVAPMNSDGEKIAARRARAEAERGRQQLAANSRREQPDARRCWPCRIAWIVA